MKRKTLLFMLLMALFMPLAMQAQTTLTVCDGTSTNSYIPVYGFYTDAQGTTSEFIMPADSLSDMVGGTISGMTFYLSTAAEAAWTGTFQVYMTEVDNTTISSITGPDACTVVYTGTLDATGTTMTVTFDNEYSYEGGNLLVGTYVSVSGNYKSAYFYGIEATSASMYSYTYGTYVQNFLPKTTFTYTAGTPASCPRPKNLAVNYTGGTTAEVSWTSDATNFNIDVNGTVTAITENPYTLTNLELATKYTVKVQADCGGSDLSDWTNPVSFTTDLCMPEDQCEISYSLTDSYGDGWNGNAIQVVDVTTGTTLATWTISSGSSATGTLAVCDGREISFVWVSGSYANETSYEVFDVNGETIFSGTNALTTVNYTVSCTTTSCKKPTDLAVSDITARTASLSWTENGEATDWQICLNGDENNLIDVREKPFTFTGLTPETAYTVKVRANCGEEQSNWSDVITFRTEVACPAPTALEVVPTPISATVTWTGDASNYNLRYGTCAETDPTQPATIILHVDDVWGDGSGYQMLLDADATTYGSTIPETGPLSTSCSGNEAIYDEFEYKIPTNADGSCTTSNIVINNTITIQIPAGTYDWCITNPTPGDRIWIAAAQGNVGGRADDYVFEGGMIYEFNIYLLGTNDATDVTIMCDNVNWTYVNNATSPYTINGLDPETEYYVSVQAVCGGEDGESAWNNTVFTTPSNCEAPSALNVTNLMPTTATLNWTGYQDGFQVWYRPTAQGAELASIDFEDSSMGSWTTIDADGDGYDWVLGSAAGGIYLEEGGTLAGTGHNNSQDLVTSGSYSNVTGVGALNPDNYLVSPQVELGGSITFWAAAQDATYAAEVFGVAVSTSSNTDASAFTTIQNWTMTSKGRYSNDGSCRTMPIKTRSAQTRSGNRAGGNWYQYTVDLSAYAGQTGYVAIRHYNCTDQFMLDVDDITIYGPATEEQEWIKLTTNATTLDIEELLPETNYEWQVQGENRNCGDDGYTEWSEMGTFTTPGLCDNPNSFILDNLTATSATVSWTGYQDSYNFWYRTSEISAQYFYDYFSSGLSNWTYDNLASTSIYEVTSDGLTGYVFWYNDSITSAQTLISTEMDPTAAGTTLSFYYASEGASTFRVGYSSTSNNIDDFTWSETVEAASSDSFAEYLDEQVPEGTKYFAVQYLTGETDGYLIVTLFDVNAIISAAGEWVKLTVNETSATMAPLVPETTYDLQVQGICGEGEEDVTEWFEAQLTTPELTTVTQTIALTQGKNWISTYLDITLDDLKAALVATVPTGTTITIKSPSENTTYTRGRWMGSLTWDVSKMYVVTVTADCELSLEGMLLDPSEHPITILGNGATTWIGYPFSEIMTITDAFTGFATNGDVLKNQNGNSSYTRGRWMGAVTELVPGLGYRYKSASGAADRTFVYPTSSKSAKGTVKPATLTDRKFVRSMKLKAKKINK